MILVDTTVWSLAYRRKRQGLNDSEVRVRRILEKAIRRANVALLGMVRQELLSGIREEAQYRCVRDDLRLFHDVELAIEDHEEAALISNSCRSSGIVGNPIDFLICAVSLRRSLPIFTLDRDFVGYASCIPIQLHSMTDGD